MSAAVPLQSMESKMLVELRKVKYSASLSEETNAFTADLYFDGKKVGYASNHGTGGPNDVHISNPADEARFRAFIAAQPPEPCDFGDGKPLTMDEDLFIGKLVEDHLEAMDKVKAEKRVQKLAAEARLTGHVALVVQFKGFAVETICKATDADAATAKINKKYGKGQVGVPRVIA